MRYGSALLYLLYFPKYKIDKRRNKALNIFVEAFHVVLSRQIKI